MKFTAKFIFLNFSARSQNFFISKYTSKFQRFYCFCQRAEFLICILPFNTSHHTMVSQKAFQKEDYLVENFKSHFKIVLCTNFSTQILLILSRNSCNIFFFLSQQRSLIFLISECVYFVRIFPWNFYESEAYIKSTFYTDREKGKMSL